jgi:hypothetical protein
MPKDEKTKQAEDKIAPEVSQWIRDMTGCAKASTEVGKKVDKHAKAQEEIAKALDLDELKKGMKYSMTEVPDGRWGAIKDKLGLLKTKDSLDKEGDPMKEIDTWHDMPGMQGLPSEDVARVQKAFKKVLDLRDKLLADPESPYWITDSKGNRVEDTQKISEDLFMPLVRQGIIPENAVPSGYSEVERTFKGASDAYEARLLKYSEGLTKTDELLAKLKPAFSVTKGLLKMGSGGAALGANITAIGDGAEGSNAIASSSDAREIDEVRRGFDNALLCVTSLETGLEKGLKEKDVFSVIDLFNTALKGVLGQAIPEAKDTVGQWSAIITMSARSSKVVKLIATDPPDIQAIFTAAGEAVENGMGAFKTKDEKNLGKFVGDTAVLGSLIKSGMTGLGGVAKGVKSRDPKVALEGLIASAQGFADTCASQYLKGKQKEFIEEVKQKNSGASPEELTEIEDYLKTNVGTKATGLKELSDGAKKYLKDFQTSIAEDAKKGVDPEKVKKEFAKFQEEQAKKLMEYRSTPDPEFALLLATGLPGGDDGETDPTKSDDAIEKDLAVQAQSIETMIAVIKKDQAAVALAKQILTGGANFLASMLPAAGIVSSGMELTFALMDAVRHHEQLIQWRDNLSDAKKSGSVQADAILNRYGLQKGQTIEADVIVLLKAVAVVAQVVKTAGGPVAPVGDAMLASTKVVEGAMDVAKTIKTEVEMAKAWKVYRRALDTPQDRKLARKALQTNPTLSKYAMAYGALVERNPVAIKVMKSCGLNEVTLGSAGTNVEKVVKYLETLYKEDPVLLRAVKVPGKWCPKGADQITVTAWVIAVEAAKKDTDPKLDKIDASAVTAALGEYARTLAPIEDKLDPGWAPDAQVDPKLFDAFISAGNALSSVLDRVKPLDKKGNAHKDFRDHCDLLSAKVQVAVGNAVRARKELAKEIDLQIELQRLGSIEVEDMEDAESEDAL